MGNENERKHDPAENRQERQGHGWDEIKKGGGGETNVGQTGADAGGASGMGTGSAGVIGGSSDFLVNPESESGGAELSSSTTEHGRGDDAALQDREGQPGPLSSSGNQQNMTGQQGGDASFGGRTGAGSSAVASNTGQSDLGSAGINQPDASGGFIGSQAGNETDGQDTPNPELAREDDLDQQEDGGMGLGSGQDGNR